MTEYQDLLYKNVMISLGRTNVQLCRACSSSIPALQVFKTRNTQVQCHRAQSRAGKQTRPVARHPLSALPGPLQAPGAPSPPRSDPAGCSQCTTGEIQGISSWRRGSECPKPQSWVTRTPVAVPQVTVPKQSPHTRGCRGRRNAGCAAVSGKTAASPTAAELALARNAPGAPNRLTFTQGRAWQGMHIGSTLPKHSGLSGGR